MMIQMRTPLTDNSTPTPFSTCNSNSSNITPEKDNNNIPTQSKNKEMTLTNVQNETETPITGISYLKKITSKLKFNDSTSSTNEQRRHTTPSSLQPTDSSLLPTFTPEEVAMHTTRDDIWMVIHGKVYDVSKIVESHPGGSEVLFDCAGVDATRSFDDVSHSDYAYDMLIPCCLGLVEKHKPKKVKFSELIAGEGNDNSTLNIDKFNNALISKTKDDIKMKRSHITDDAKSTYMIKSSIEKKKKKSSSTKKKFRNYQEFKKVQREEQLRLQEWSKNVEPFILKSSATLFLFFAILGLLLFVYLQRKKWSEWII